MHQPDRKKFIREFAGWDKRLALRKVAWNREDFLKKPLQSQEFFSSAMAVESDGKTMGFAVGKQDLFLAALDDCFIPDQALRLMLGILDHANHGSAT